MIIIILLEFNLIKRFMILICGLLDEMDGVIFVGWDDVWWLGLK